jgi:hypothetical protein
MLDVWQLEEHSRHEGYFFIKSGKEEDYRLGMWHTTLGSHLQAQKDNKNSNVKRQLWKFVPVVGKVGYYTIVNMKYPERMIAKEGKVGLRCEKKENRSPEAYNWCLQPVFNVTEHERIICEQDNGGSYPQSLDLKQTIGVTNTTTDSWTTTTSFEVKAMLDSLKGTGFNAKYGVQLQQYTCVTETVSKVEERTVKCTIPAQRYYKVYQTYLLFKSENQAIPSRYFYTDIIRTEEKPMP